MQFAGSAILRHDADADQYLRCSRYCFVVDWFDSERTLQKASLRVRPDQLVWQYVLMLYCSLDGLTDRQSEQTPPTCKSFTVLLLHMCCSDLVSPLDTCLMPTQTSRATIQRLAPTSAQAWQLRC